MANKILILETDRLILKRIQKEDAEDVYRTMNYRGNDASLKVLQKQGFHIIGKKDLKTAKCTILTCHLLELSVK